MPLNPTLTFILFFICRVYHKLYKYIYYLFTYLLTGPSPLPEEEVHCCISSMVPKSQQALSKYLLDRGIDLCAAVAKKIHGKVFSQEVT
jgi:hypothetical protein